MRRRSVRRGCLRTPELLSDGPAATRRISNLASCVFLIGGPMPKRSLSFSENLSEAWAQSPQWRLTKKVSSPAAAHATIFASCRKRPFCLRYDVSFVVTTFLPNQAAAKEITWERFPTTTPRRKGCPKTSGGVPFWG